jgi:3-methyladenine DNA glycosylase AlkC
LNLKDEYNEAFVADLAIKISTKASSFDRHSFIKSIINSDWKSKELKERVRCVSENIHSHLLLPYQKQIAILIAIAPNFKGLQLFIFSDFVEIYGLNNVSTSFNAMEIFTELFTSEMAIRPFIEKHQKETMNQLLKWSLSDNHHYRRLASEGSRPRLPWARPLRNFIKNPEPTLPILENLKNDDSLYVRKSVANHLNDISKDHPELVLQIANKWHGNSKNTNWIVKHGLRTLLKKGNKKALAIFGLDNSKNIKIENLSLSHKKIKIGEFIHFEFDIINRSNKRRNIRLEYKIAYVKANGETSNKVFQISEFILTPKSNKSFKRKQWFKELSTRKHYPGKHKITLIINGDEKGAITLDLNPLLSQKKTKIIH